MKEKDGEGGDRTKLSGRPLCNHFTVDSVRVRDKAIDMMKDMARHMAAKSGATVAFGKPTFYQQASAGGTQPCRCPDHAAAVMAENMLVNEAEEEIALFIEKCGPSWTESWPYPPIVTGWPCGVVR